MDLVEVGSKISLFFIPFLFAICFHEWAHALVARIKGDPTAEMMGRLTLNPLPHIDPLGTVVFPMLAILSGGFFFFGWAKPVPVSVRNLKEPSKDMFWIAIAGPLSNLFLAVVAAFLLGANARFNPFPDYADAIMKILQFFIIINLSLMVFNFIPIHPLDGGKILARFLPSSANEWLENNSSTLGVALLAFIILDGLTGRGSTVIGTPVRFLYENLVGAAGYFFAFVI